jgi:HD-like signal output (HDOD) protein
MFYAHTSGNDQKDWQKLIDHLTNTANIARELGQDSNLSEFAYPVAMLHDIGK